MFLCPIVSLNICLSECLSVQLFLWIFVCPRVCPKSIDALPILLVALRIAKVEMQQFSCLHTGYDGMSVFWRHRWTTTECMKETESSLISRNPDHTVRCRIFCIAICCLGIQRTLVLVEIHKLRNFANRVLKEGLWGRWLHIDKLHDTQSSPNISRVTQSRINVWAGHVAWMGKKRNI